MIDFKRNGKICQFTLTNDLLDFLVDNHIYFGKRDTLRKQKGARYSFESSVKVGAFSSIFFGGEIVDIGSFSFSRSSLSRGMKIGNYCSLANGVTTMGLNHAYERFSSSSFTSDHTFPIFADCAPDLINRFKHAPNKRGWVPKVEIEHDVWIGGGAMLANNITVGTGSIVAARAVVTKDVQPYDIVGGNPARVIRKRFPQKICDRLVASDWFHYKFPHFTNVDVCQDIEIQLEQLETQLLESDVPKIAPQKLFMGIIEEYLGQKCQETIVQA